MLKHVLALFAAAAAFAPHSAAQAQPPAAVTPPAPAAAPRFAHVETRGNGPIALILIPGLNCDWPVFDAFMTRNAARYTMYAVRLPGFGGSQPPTTAADSTFRDGAWMNAAEEAVVHLIKDKKLDRPVVAGHSLGGHLALRVGAHHPELVRAVIDIDGYPILPYPGDAPPPKEQRATQAEAMAQNIPEDAEAYRKYTARYASGSVADPKRAAELAAMMSVVPRSTMLRYFAEIVVSDLSADFRANKTRALVIAAVAPAPEPMRARIRATWERLASPIGNCTTVYFEDTHHFVMDDAPSELDAAFAAFIEGKPVPGKAGKPAAAPDEAAPKPQGAKP